MGSYFRLFTQMPIIIGWAVIAISCAVIETKTGYHFAEHPIVVGLVGSVYGVLTMLTLLYIEYRKRKNRPRNF